MLRWLFLLLLLANALLFFWYAQQQPSGQETTASNQGNLRLLSELPHDEILPARERECLSYGPVPSQSDAQRLIALLADEPVSATAMPLPPAIVGYRLTLPLPADAAARIELLDELARQGWVPETRGGRLSLGTFADLEALQRVRDTLSPALAERTEAVPNQASNGAWEVRVQHLSGYKIPNKINQLIRSSWSDIKIEKKPCKGVARPRSDQ